MSSTSASSRTSSASFSASAAGSTGSLTSATALPAPPAPTRLVAWATRYARGTWWWCDGDEEVLGRASCGVLEEWRLLGRSRRRVWGAAQGDEGAGRRLGKFRFPEADSSPRHLPLRLSSPSFPFDPSRPTRLDTLRRNGIGGDSLRPNLRLGGWELTLVSFLAVEAGLRDLPYPCPPW